jgi:hypothetical protein
MATHSSIPAWEIPWTEEPDGLWSMESQESDTTEATEHTYALVCLQPCSDQSLTAQAHYNQLSASTGSKSMDSTNHGLKILRQKIPESSKKPNLNLPQSGNNFHSISIVLVL